MRVAIAGMGWVTPLGAGLNEVWAALMEGRSGHEVELKSPDSDRIYRCLGVEETLVRPLTRTPRLRRSSAISYYTAAAGLAAIADAGLERERIAQLRFALIFAVASGGVAYTRRFYEKVARDGAGSASPLLFPETVYNAPASHLSSLLGTEGATYTLVGDATVGVEALSLGRQLLRTDEADYCLVVGGEELDWILCEAYRQWRLLDFARSGEIYARRPRGMQMSEGAASVLLAREGPTVIDRISGGVPFFRRAEIGDALAAALAPHAAADIVVSSANGTFIDAAERNVLASRASQTLFAPKSLLGEPLGSGALAQVICAAQALARQELPGTVRAGDWAVVNRQSRSLKEAKTALVPVVGLNHQVAAVGLRV